MEESEALSQASGDEPVGLSVTVLFYVFIFIGHAAIFGFLDEKGNYHSSHGPYDTFQRSYGVDV